MSKRKKNSHPTLTREERGLLALGRAAEHFVASDREARAIRAKRNELGQALWYNHYDEDHPPCFEVQITVEEEDGDTWTDRLPVEKWCEDCRKYAKAHDEAAAAYFDRRSARQALTAAYRRLLKIREKD
jgi:hypothetical protein